MQEINISNKIKKNKYPRIFVNSNLALGEIIHLDKLKSHHISHVLRKKLEDYVKVFNEVDGEFVARIIKLAKSKTTIEVIENFPVNYKAKKIGVIFSPIKQHRMSFLIEKACELGASHLYPVICQYTSNRNFNLEKWELTAIDAAQQSERISIPTIYSLQNLEKLIETWPRNKIILFMDERQNSKSISKFLESYSYDDSYTILVGPEGGFSSSEDEYLRSFDFVKPINLGSMILRSETAIIATMAIIQTNLN